MVTFKGEARLTLCLRGGVRQAPRTDLLKLALDEHQRGTAHTAHMSNTYSK